LCQRCRGAKAEYVLQEDANMTKKKNEGNPEADVSKDVRALRTQLQ